MIIKTIKCLQDNYSYIIVDKTINSACVIDPSEALPIIEFLEKKKNKSRFYFKYTSSLRPCRRK